MAFRAEFKELILPIPDQWMHDAWFALCISAVSRGFPLSEPLVRYRQHSSQQIGERPRDWLQQYRIVKNWGAENFQQRFEGFSLLRDRLRSPGRWPVSNEKLNLLDRKIEFLSARCRMRSGSIRLPQVAKHAVLGNYGRFAEGWKAICQDLMLP